MEAMLSCVVRIHGRFCEGNFSSRKDIAFIGLNIIHGLYIPLSAVRRWEERINSLRSYEHVVVMANQLSSSVT